MDLFAPRHLLIILLIVVLVFGVKKLKTIGPDLGAAVRGFKKAMHDGETEEQAKQIQGPASKDAEFPEVAVSKPAPPPVNEQKAAPHA
ncbi:MAG TPA: twin-arginine translocase TatA/TatE family subunit [Steroidobacteraceae bacterium]|nr:twin-arginine translocase TatA/TatE family subunit [Steroidobacteraceae bacterium]